jgi:hypothetical protein
LTIIYAYGENLGMTTSHRIEPKTFRLRKKPKKPLQTLGITREPFGDNPIEILPIPTFIDDHNHYIGVLISQTSSERLLRLIFLEIKRNSFQGLFRLLI